jgi:DNA-binding transcriptional ArsR family regulator
MKSQADTALRALAQPNRIAILALIRTRELPATKIAGHFQTTRSAISQHLRVLTEAGLLHERRDGTKRLYRLRPEGLRGVRKLLDLFWDVKLDRLKSAVELEARRHRER